MFKHPWFLKKYRFSEEEEIDRNANRFYWICLIISGALLGWFGFWLNYNEIGAKSHPSLAIPCSIMFFLLVVLMGAHFVEPLPRKWKYVVGCLTLILSVIITDPIRMITY